MEAKSTLNVTREVINTIIPTLDANDFFFLGKESTDRMDLFNFALSLGVKEGYPTPLKTSISLVRTERLERDSILQMSLYRSIYYSKKIATGDATINQIEDNDAVLTLIEQYANTGFIKLKEYMDEYDTEALTYKLISELKSYKSIE